MSALYLIGYDERIADLHLKGRQRLEVILGRFRANVEVGAYYKITKFIVQVAIYIFGLLLFCSSYKLNRHFICYFNDYALRKAFHIEKWKDIITDEKVKKVQKIYSTVYSVLGADQSIREVPAISFEVRLSENTNLDNEERHILLHNGYNYAGIKDGVEYQNEALFWTVEMELPPTFGVEDISLMQLQGGDHIIQTKDRLYLSKHIGSSEERINALWIDFFSQLKQGAVVLYNIQRKGERLCCYHVLENN